MAGGAEPRNGRRPPRVAIVLITLAVALVAALVACTDDPPKPPPSTTAPVTTPPSPTAQVPTVAEAKPTPESAEAFVRHFWEIYNYAYQTLDTEPLAAISADTCKFCASAMRDISRLQSNDTRIEGARVLATSVAAPPGKISNGVIVATVITQEAGRSIEASGSVEQLKAIGKRRSYVGLDWEDDTWHVDGVTIGKPGASD